MRLFARGAAVAVVAIASWAAPASADFRRVTPDGGAFVFSTTEALTASDTDTAADVYVRAGGVNELASVGTAGGAFAQAISTDASRVFFSTAEQLSAADTDSDYDLYERSRGQTTLITTGPTDPGPLPWYELAHISPDGSRVIFGTSADLVPEDTDGERDLYMRSNGVTTLLSASPAGSSGPHGHYFVGASLDGTRVFEGTDEALVSNDTDGAGDFYERSGGTVKLVTTGTLDTGSAPHSAWIAGGASDDGSSFIYMTDAKFELGDTNGTLDLYQRRNGKTRLLTANRLGLVQPCPIPAGHGGPEPCTIFRAAQTTDGGSVFFGAGQALASTDTNSTWDMYLRTGSSLEHVAQGYDGWMSPDGARLVFRSVAALVPADTDSKNDLYERAGGQFKLLTPGTPVEHLDLAASSRDLTHVFFVTQEGVDPADTDNRRDVYESVGGTVRLVTSGPADDHANVSDSEHTKVYPSDDGSRVYFFSKKALVAADTDVAEDAYVWEDGVTTLVSG
ncbi:MAG TPA: hypothetical protein VF517_05320 [Thermoleophilaceae bacterium]|jgi:hypothetical protein